MTGRRYLLLTSLLSILIFVLANILFQPRMDGARIDFTEGGLYTVSEGTKNTLKDLAEPVELTFVYTRRVAQDFPGIRSYAARVRELLQAYKGVAGADLEIREIDPTPFSRAEDEVIDAGISAIETGGDDPLYFGIIGRNRVDDVRVIPFLSPDTESTLEYDLTRLITRLDKPDPPVVTILSSMRGMQGDGREDGYFILREAAKSFQIRQLAANFVTIPEDTDVLFIAHPPELTEYQLYLIDQFLLRTGRALILLDPASKASAGDGSIFDVSEKRTRSDLARIADTYGVILSETAVADIEHALVVPVETDDGRVVNMEQPLFMSIPRGLVSPQDVITSDLSRTLNFGASGAFSVDLEDGQEFTPLVVTSEAPSLIDAERAARNMSPGDVLKAYEVKQGPYALAGRQTGPLKTAFPNGTVPLDVPDDPVLAELAIAAAGEASPHLSEAVGPVDIVWVADADLLDDGFFINLNTNQLIADNAAFILNALDNLGGGQELVTLRSRAPSLRPMTLVDNMRSEAQQRFQAEEARLTDQLARAQARMEELRQRDDTGGFFDGDLETNLSSEERAELATLRQDISRIRDRLRDIERDFRRNIDGLERTLKIVNIWGGPFLVILLGFFVWRRQQRGGA